MAITQNKYEAQNGYTQTLQNNLLSGQTGEIEINLSVPPTSNFGWLVLEPNSAANYEEIFYHRKTATSVYVYDTNRKNPKDHAAGITVTANNTAGIYNYFSQNIENLFYIYKKDAKNIEIFGGEITDNGTRKVIQGVDSITGITLHNGQRTFIYLDKDYKIQTAIVETPNMYVVAEVVKDITGFITSIERKNIASLSITNEGELPSNTIAGKFLSHDGTNPTWVDNPTKDFPATLIAGKILKVKADASGYEFVDADSLEVDEEKVKVDGTILTGRLQGTITNLKQVISKIDALVVPAQTITLDATEATGNLQGKNISDVRELYRSIDRGDFSNNVDPASVVLKTTGLVGKMVGVRTLKELYERLEVLAYNAGEITLDVTNFNKNLGATETTVQKALEKLDDLVTSSTTLDTTNFNGLLDNTITNLQKFADKVDNILASNIKVDVTNFNKNLGATEDTVQKALEKLDDLTIVGSDGKVKVSANDTTAKELKDKVVAGIGLATQISNAGGDEKLLIEKASAISGGSASTIYSDRITYTAGSATAPALVSIEGLIETYQILNRRDTAANWTGSNPILGEGEFGIESDTNKFKLGDGVSNWATLQYFTVPTTVTIDTANFDKFLAGKTTLDAVLDKIDEVTTDIDTAKTDAIAAAKTYTDTNTYTRGQVDAAVAGNTDTKKVKLTATDNTEGYMLDKLLEGNGIEYIRTSVGANEKLTLNTKVDNSTINFNAGKLQVKDNSINGSKLASNINGALIGLKAASLDGVTLDDLATDNQHLLSAAKTIARINTATTYLGVPVDRIASFSNTGKIQDSGYTDSSFVKTSDVDQTISGKKTFLKEVEFKGDIIVSGVNAKLDVASLEIKDPIIRLNNGETSGGVSPNGGRAGILIDRGTEMAAQLFWDETANDFLVTYDNFATTKSITSGTGGAGTGAISGLSIDADKDFNGHKISNVTVLEKFAATTEIKLEVTGSTDKVLVSGVTSIVDVKGYITHLNGDKYAITTKDFVRQSGGDIIIDTTSDINFTGTNYVIVLTYI